MTVIVANTKGDEGGGARVPYCAIPEFNHARQYGERDFVILPRFSVGSHADLSPRTAAKAA